MKDLDMSKLQYPPSMLHVEVIPFIFGMFNLYEIHMLMFIMFMWIMLLSI